MARKKLAYRATVSGVERWEGLEMFLLAWSKKRAKGLVEKKAKNADGVGLVHITRAKEYDLEHSRLDSWLIGWRKEEATWGCCDVHEETL